MMSDETFEAWATEWLGSGQPLSGVVKVAEVALRREVAVRPQVRVFDHATRRWHWVDLALRLRENAVWRREQRAAWLDQACDEARANDEKRRALRRVNALARRDAAA